MSVWVLDRFLNNNYSHILRNTRNTTPAVKKMSTTKTNALTN